MGVPAVKHPGLRAWTHTKCSHLPTKSTHTHTPCPQVDGMDVLAVEHPDWRACTHT